MKVYDYEELIKLLNADSRYFVINGDDVDKLFRKKNTYKIEYIDTYSGKEFLYTNNILKRREHIYSGASIYKLQTYQDEIKDRIADGQNLVFVNPKNDIAFSDSILTYYHLFDYAGKTFEIDGHIIDWISLSFLFELMNCKIILTL